MAEIFNFDGSKFGSDLTYRYSEDIDMWEARIVLTQQYKREDSEEWEEPLKVELFTVEETFNEAVNAINQMVIDVMTTCDGDFRLLEDKAPDFSD